MADDKTIKIKLEDGSSSPGNPPVDDEAIKKAQEEAKRIQEALQSAVFATQDILEETAEKVSKRRGRPPKDESPDTPTPDESDPNEKKPLPLRILNNLQKVVTAFEGVNGRATKALAVLSRSTKAYYEHQAKATKATAAATTATTATTTATTTAATAATRLGAITATAGVALGVVTKVLGGVAIAGGAVSAAFLLASVAAKGFSKLIENLEEVVGNFSGALEAARAKTQVATLQEQIRSGRRIGGDLADLEETNKQLKTELISLKTKFIELMEPFIKVVGEALVKILQVMNLIFTVLNWMQDFFSSALSKILEPLTHIPGLGKAAKALQDWLTKQEIDAAGAGPLNRQIEDLFDQDQFNFPKNGPTRRFLP